MGQIELVKAAQGVGILPCLVANRDETLIRVDVGAPQKAQDIWILKHSDLRSSERIRVVSRFFSDILRSNMHRFTA
jgi:DNA-binding transcriptional LysR family regulator